MYVDAIQEDIKWLGFQWSGDVRFASSYFDQFYDWAIHLIKEGKAYVDHQDAETMRENRGNFTKPGVATADRSKSVEDNLAEFEKMRAGDYEEGQASLRAKIDLQSSNMNMRDPVLYRVRKVSHHQTGDKWCIYPSYDFAHGQEDAIEGITHSICTLEFQDHRPLYEWFIENLPVPHKPTSVRICPHQPELHHHFQAQAEASWWTKAYRQWLGRPAHADRFRYASSWFYTDVYSQVLRDGGRQPY